MNTSPKKKRTLPQWMKPSNESHAFAKADRSSDAHSSDATVSCPSSKRRDLSSNEESVDDDAFQPQPSTGNHSADHLSDSGTDHEDVSVSNHLVLKDGNDNGLPSTNGSENKKNSADDMSPTVGTVNQGTPVALLRQPCYYGTSCYRKNPQHRKDFAHPGDADYQGTASPSSASGASADDRPLCEYGSACYRKNPQHRIDFRHDTPKKRKARPAQIQDLASDDDGDFNESVGSDDFNPGDSGESDDSFVTSDSVSSGNSDYDPEDEDGGEEKKKKKKVVQTKKKARKK